MKTTTNLLLLALLIINPNFSYSQFQQLDYEIQQIWENGEWVDVLKNEFHYNQAGLLSDRITYNLEVSSDIPAGKESFKYNPNNQLVLIQNSDWNSGTQSYDSAYYRTVYTFDQDGNQTSYLGQMRQFFQQDWRTRFKGESFYVDNFLMKENIYSYNNQSQSIYLSSIDTFYYTDNVLTRKERQRYDQFDKVFELYSKVDYEYNTTGLISFEKTSYYYNEAWEPVRLFYKHQYHNDKKISYERISILNDSTQRQDNKYTYEYDNNDNPFLDSYYVYDYDFDSLMISSTQEIIFNNISLENTYTPALNHFKLHNSEHISFQPTELIEKRTDFQNGTSLENSFRTLYFYKDSDVGISDNNKILVNVYPNPASNTISFEKLKANENYHLILIDSKGNIVKNMKLKNQVNISKLNTGLYTYQITNSTGLIASGQFVKN